MAFKLHRNTSNERLKPKSFSQKNLFPLSSCKSSIMGCSKQIKQLSSTCRNIDNVQARQQMHLQKEVQSSLAASYIKLFSSLDHFFARFARLRKCFPREREKWAWESVSRSVLSVCVTFFFSSTQRSIWNVLFLFQFKFYILGVHTRLFDRGRDFFTFAFSVFISLRFVHKREKKIFSSVNFCVFFGDFLCQSYFMTYQFDNFCFSVAAWLWRPMDRIKVMISDCVIERGKSPCVVKWSVSIALWGFMDCVTGRLTKNISTSNPNHWKKGKIDVK